MALDADAQINMVPNTVAYKYIDREGGTKRFYRQVFLDKFRENSSFLNADEMGLQINSDTETGGEDCSDSTSSFCLRLDNRLLTINDSPIIIDNYDLALMCAAELESQAEYIRIESMPICEIVTNLIERNLGLQAMPRDIQRQSWRESVKSRLSHDLLLTAEDGQLKSAGFYEQNWQPLIAWFNQTFELDLKLDYIVMKGETDNVESMTDAMNSNTMYDLDLDEVLDKYQLSEMAQKVNYLTEKFKGHKYEYGLIPKFLASLDDVRLMLLDEMIRFSYSPIVSIAILLNAVSVRQAITAIECPELDVQMIVPHEEQLKMNQTVLNLVAVRNFLNCFDQIVPFCDNKIINKYETPIIC